MVSATSLAQNMDPIISIIIPVLHEAPRINAVLDHLSRMKPTAPFEIIVVDGARERDTLASINNHTVVKVPSERGRGRQMNAGAARATGQILLFLHADTLLPKNGLLDVENVMTDDRYVGGAFDLGIDSQHWFLKVSEKVGTIRSRITRLPYGDQAIFVRKAFFDQIGGYQDLLLMEDVDLMQRIKKSGNRICFIPKRVRTSARRWEKDGAIKGTLRNWTLISLYFLGVSPERLAKYYKEDRTKSMIIRSSILLFVKYPAKGTVKTRLARSIGEDAAARLYQCFVADLLATLKQGDYSKTIYFTPSLAKDSMGEWLGMENNYVAQSGRDLGERMKNAFLDAFAQGVERALLIGSDVPDITKDILDEALAALEHHGAVIGPAMDGGYYLIGFNASSFQPDVFDHIEWSTATVFEGTMDIFNASGQRVHRLPRLRDIDTLDDLKEHCRTQSPNTKKLSNLLHYSNSDKPR